MMFHGNPIPADDDPMVHWRIKSQANEEARQQFLEGYVPQVWELGLTLPDPKLARGEDGIWAYTEPDWEKLDGGRLRERAGVGRADRVPQALARRDRLGLAHGARRGGMSTVVFEVFRRERAGAPMQHAGSIVAPDTTLRRGLRARAVRPPRRVDGALARPARGGRRDRGLRRRVRPQVPPGRRLLDQGAAEGGT